MATKANKEEYLGSPLAVPYKVFESDFKRALRQKAMVRDADNAVKNYKEVEAETARGQKKDSTPTVAEVITPEAQASMENQEKNRKLDAEVEKGATKGDTTRRTMGKPLAKGGSVRGSGCESSGKTKGKFV